MQTISLWEDISGKRPSYPKLTKDIEVDVAIIGGGITGVTTAYQLVQSGKKIAILEANKIGGVTSSSSTGNLYIGVQALYQNIIKKFDLTTAKKVAQSRKDAIEYIEKTVSENNISCHFTRRPWYIYANKEIKTFKDEVECLKRMGFNIDYTSEFPLSTKFHRAALMPNQARFNPLQYIVSLAAESVKRGCEIFEKTRIIKISETDICKLETNIATVHAKKVLLATHTPIGINSTQFFTAPYRSYVIAAKTQENNYPEGHFWNVDTPKNTICTHSISNEHPELIMIAGSHHKTGQEPPMDKHYKVLEKLLTKKFNLAKITHQWSAQHYQSADCLPYIGLATWTSKHIYLATGYWADGLTYGTLAGLLISDSILQNKNPFASVYQSTRHNLIAAAPFSIKENANVFLQYLKDIPIFSSPNLTKIKMGKGKIVEINQEKCAVSRDESNQLHVVSAVCPHMKCIVNWNDAEKTWDCPCHGSRFTVKGIVIEGPATQNLENKSTLFKE